MRTVLLDTNVLLSDPDAVFGYHDAEVIIPETVLGELDKIKTSRVDADLRFRGRKVSRILFELSETGTLMDGVDMPDGGRLRVVSLDPSFKLPNGLSGRNADDRILGTALQVCETGCEGLTVVTSDLNMLLKAQTLGLEVERPEGGADSTFARRYIVRPFQRYKIPLAILAIALAVFAAIVVVALMTQGSGTSMSGVPPEFRTTLSEQQEQILDYLLRLQENPTDLDTQLQLANEYFDRREHTGEVTYADLARKYYEQYLQSRPDDPDVRTDLAISYYILGRTDRAIQEVTTVLQGDPDHVNANYNLGVFYWKGRGDLTAATAQFNKVVELTQGSTDSRLMNARAAAETALMSIEGESGEETGAPSGGV